MLRYIRNRDAAWRTLANPFEDSYRWERTLRGCTYWVYAVVVFGCSSQALGSDGLLGAPLAWAVSGFAATLVSLYDMATYRPQMFALADPHPRPKSVRHPDITERLAQVDGGILKIYRELASTPARTWREIEIQERNYLAEATQFSLLNKVKWRIVRLFLLKLFQIVASLSILAYGLYGLFGCQFITPPSGMTMPHACAGAGYVTCLYFTVTTFFTIGFGDIGPAYPVGYLFTAWCMVLLVTVTYFVFTEAASGFANFEDRLRYKVRVWIVARALVN